MIRDSIKNTIEKALSSLGISQEGVVVSRTEQAEHGDYATNIALVLAKELGKNPRELAEAIKNAIEKEGNDTIAKIEIAGPGFINFFIKDEVFIKNIDTIRREKDTYGKSDLLRGKRIMVEYTQPNPFKPFHIGHLMSNAIGESISRLVEFGGAEVIRANYQGDVGLHVAKAIWGIQKKGYDPKNIDQLGEAYVYGNTMYEDDEEAKNEIHTINKHVYAGDDETINTIYKDGRDASLARFEELYKKLGTTFDHYFFESETWRRGQELVEKHTGDVFEKSDSAIVFPGEKYGLHTRVFITSEGVPTYDAKEIGLAFLKMEKETFDLSITITAVEQEEYFKVIFKALTIIDQSMQGIFRHIPHGMMQLAEGKMSSRKGNVITGESLIVEAEKAAKEKMDSEQVVDKNTLATQIGVAALKYPILRQSLGRNIIFDMKDAISFEGDSGPYLQYTHARISSILTKTETSPSIESPETPEGLERTLLAFPETVALACTEYAPSRITTYLIELAQEFNSYYGQYKIIDNPYRLALAEATAIVIKNGLHLLGISAPSKM